MRAFMFAVTVLAAFGAVTVRGAVAAPICATTASTNTDCGFIITVNPDGSLSGSAVAGANPYDGSDDALVGVINNSGSIFTGSIALTGSGNGGGLFGFDGDGICNYAFAAYCASAHTGYEGPLNTFTNITGVTSNSGVVDFSTLGGIAIGGSTFFSLEGSPASILAGGGIGTPVPEPMSLALLGFTVGAMLLARRPMA